MFIFSVFIFIFFLLSCRRFKKFFKGRLDWNELCENAAVKKLFGSVNYRGHILYINNVMLADTLEQGVLMGNVM